MTGTAERKIAQTVKGFIDMIDGGKFAKAHDQYLTPPEEKKRTHETCCTCDGKGELLSECCGGVIVSGLCTQCGENADEEECPDCEGEGEIPAYDEPPEDI